MSVSEQSQLTTHYGGIVRKRLLSLTLLVALLAASLLLDLCLGPSALRATEVLQGLLEPESLKQASRVILWDIRLPYSLMAVLTGLSLGLAGAKIQTVLNNPLASPYTLGLSSAATLGASLALVFDINPAGLSEAYQLPAMAFLASLAVCLLIHRGSQLLGGGVTPVILLGICMYFSCHALVALVQYLADANAVQQIVFWTLGSLGRADWPKLTILAVVFLLVSLETVRRHWTLTAMKSGEEQARSIGLQVDRERLRTLITASLLAATAVSFVGAIGFVGLVGPHLSRLLFGEDHRFYLAGSALLGALLMSLASMASKSLLSGVIIPIGIVTALVGIPLFLTLLFRQRGQL